MDSPDNSQAPPMVSPDFQAASMAREAALLTDKPDSSQAPPMVSLVSWVSQDLEFSTDSLDSSSVSPSSQAAQDSLDLMDKAA